MLRTVWSRTTSEKRIRIKAAVRRARNDAGPRNT